MEPRVNWQLTVRLPGTRTKTRSDFQNWDPNYFSPNPGFHLLGTKNETQRPPWWEEKAYLAVAIFG
jgi:hypothetical protein